MDVNDNEPAGVELSGRWLRYRAGAHGVPSVLRYTEPDRVGCQLTSAGAADGSPKARAGGAGGAPAAPSTVLAWLNAKLAERVP